MDKITLKPCCALCGLLWNKKCPLYQVYEAASGYGDDTFDEKAMYVIRCDAFSLKEKYIQE